MRRGEVDWEIVEHVQREFRMELRFIEGKIAELGPPPDVPWRNPGPVAAPWGAFASQHPDYAARAHNLGWRYLLTARAALRHGLEI